MLVARASRRDGLSKACRLAFVVQQLGTRRAKLVSEYNKARRSLQRAPYSRPPRPQHRLYSVLKSAPPEMLGEFLDEFLCGMVQDE